MHPRWWILTISVNVMIAIGVVGAVILASTKLHHAEVRAVEKVWLRPLTRCQDASYWVVFSLDTCTEVVLLGMAAIVILRLQSISRSYWKPLVGFGCRLLHIGCFAPATLTWNAYTTENRNPFVAICWLQAALFCAVVSASAFETFMLILRRASDGQEPDECSSEQGQSSFAACDAASTKSILPRKQSAGYTTDPHDGTTVTYGASGTEVGRDGSSETATAGQSVHTSWEV